MDTFIVEIDYGNGQPTRMVEYVSRAEARRQLAQALRLYRIVGSVSYEDRSPDGFRDYVCVDGGGNMVTAYYYDAFPVKVAT
jgi:hypothetical protein